MLDVRTTTSGHERSCARVVQYFAHCLLLMIVVVNLSDFPYIDEIFGSEVGQRQEQSLRPSAVDGATNSTAPAKARGGPFAIHYISLLYLGCPPESTALIPVPLGQQYPDVVGFLPFVMPSRIDRPPRC